MEVPLPAVNYIMRRREGDQVVKQLNELRWNNDHPKAGGYLGTLVELDGGLRLYANLSQLRVPEDGEIEAVRRAEAMDVRTPVQL